MVAVMNHPAPAGLATEHSLLPLVYPDQVLFHSNAEKIHPVIDVRQLACLHLAFYIQPQPIRAL